MTENQYIYPSLRGRITLVVLALLLYVLSLVHDNYLRVFHQKISHMAPCEGMYWLGLEVIFYGFLLFSTWFFCVANALLIFKTGQYPAKGAYVIYKMAPDTGIKRYSAILSYLVATVGITGFCIFVWINMNLTNLFYLAFWDGACR